MIASIYARRYHAVVMNPPYIVPPTAAAREAYRARYVSAHARFGMGVCFTERAHELLVDGGFCAQITSNAFMKREYGKAHVEKVLSRYDITDVIDTSGACISGHGTPTVILVTRHRAPTGAPVRCVMSRRGEPEAPKGHVGRVWSSILAGLGMPPFAAPNGPTPIGLVWAGALAKTTKTLAAEIAADAKLSREDAAPIAAAWVTTAGALRLVDQIAGLMRDRVSDDAEHLGRSFERVAELLPDAEWWNPDTGINPCWRRALTDAQSARVRAAVARVVDPSAVPVEQSGTDWIGDLYQGLDDAARDEHAFCQTPFFVRDLLLDLGVAPALQEFGDGATVLDPACGTGHLLVGAFRRLYLRRADPEDGAPEHTYARCARMALAQVAGGDLNPVAAAIARFRLMLAYLAHADGIRHLGNVPDDLPIRVEVADALLADRPEGHRIHAAATEPPSPVATLLAPPKFDPPPFALTLSERPASRKRPLRPALVVHKTTVRDAKQKTGDGFSFGDWVDVPEDAAEVSP